MSDARGACGVDLESVIANSRRIDALSGETGGEFAFLRDRDGGYVIGHGPFEERDSPPESGVAFYRNDFGLTDPMPWKVPSRVERMKTLDLPGVESDPLVVNWDGVTPEGFAEVFAEVTEAMGRGSIEKTVPVVTERGVVQRGAVKSLVMRLRDLPEVLQGFGWIGEGGAFVGATPEKLLRLEDGVVETMAVAGTARTEDQAVFEVDQKEIREHEYVAGSLAAKLSDIGILKREARRVMRLGPLVHFQTPIQVSLFRAEEPGDLIRRLHPTPALGPLPRTGESMEQLLEWRQRLGCPDSFGAPFGLWCDGVLTVLVAIRMISWKGGEVLLPAGCGVIAESRLVNEWRELRLKRDAVKAVFGIEEPPLA